jgi:hypothetical protein
MDQNVYVQQLSLLAKIDLTHVYRVRENLQKADKSIFFQIVLGCHPRFLVFKTLIEKNFNNFFALLVFQIRY